MSLAGASLSTCVKSAMWHVLTCTTLELTESPRYKVSAMLLQVNNDRNQQEANQEKNEQNVENMEQQQRMQSPSQVRIKSMGCIVLHMSMDHAADLSLRVFGCSGWVLCAHCVSPNAHVDETSRRHSYTCRWSSSGMLRGHIKFQYNSTASQHCMSVALCINVSLAVPAEACCCDILQG